MSSIGSINPLGAPNFSTVDAPAPKLGVGTPAGLLPAGTTDSFGKMLDGIVANVETKQQTADALTRRVLLGESDQLHQSVIAMQEASVSFSLMVEVRNKLVESYQELMRMQV